MVSNIVTLDELDDLFADFIQDKLELQLIKCLFRTVEKDRSQVNMEKMFAT